MFRTTLWRCSIYLRVQSDCERLFDAVEYRERNEQQWLRSLEILRSQSEHLRRELRLLRALDLISLQGIEKAPDEHERY